MSPVQSKLIGSGGIGGRVVQARHWRQAGGSAHQIFLQQHAAHLGDAGAPPEAGPPLNPRPVPRVLKGLSHEVKQAFVDILI